MNKLVKTNLFEFTRGGDPLKTLSIGYTAKIYKFFDDLDISRDDYTIEDKQIKFVNNLYLSNCINLVKLPDNLNVGHTLYLNDCTSLVELPNNLKIGGSLFLEGCTSLVELPNNLKINDYIYVYNIQYELIKWIKSSNKFKRKLRTVIKFIPNKR